MPTNGILGTSCVPAAAAPTPTAPRGHRPLDQRPEKGHSGVLLGPCQRKKKASVCQHHNSEAAAGETRVGPREVESKKPKPDPRFLSGGPFCPQTRRCLPCIHRRTSLAHLKAWAAGTRASSRASLHPVGSPRVPCTWISVCEFTWREKVQLQRRRREKPRVWSSPFILQLSKKGLAREHRAGTSGPKLREGRRHLGLLGTCRLQVPRGPGHRPLP